MIHAQSQLRISTLLKAALDITEVRRSSIVLSRNEFHIFDDIASEFNKRKGVNIKFDRSKCISIYEDALCQYVSDNNGLKQDNYYKFNAESNKDPIVNFIYSFFLKFPIDYKIHIHLKNLYLPENFNFKYIETSNFESIDVDGEVITGTKIGLGITGFYDWRDRTPFIREVKYNLNIILFLLFKFKMIYHSPASVWSKNYQINYNGINFLNVEQVKITIDSFRHPYISPDFDLELSFSKYLNELAVETKHTDATEMGNTLSSVFRLAEDIIEDKSKEASRIKFAIDWYMQSLSNSDNVMSFIQLCIGLESIYGDDNYEGSLTKSLADRCAYLIGQTISGRKKIHSNIREIYIFRSKIIHGVIFSHDSRFEEIQNQASFYLRESINMELKSMGWIC